ncbi:metallophosphoesterase [Clostridium sp.]|uniref:metallophosphoesterase n=1 Tax=Clostridium sp. TaxID=1506 RepID=UPI002636D4AF|nr:metallophosphoesterase [Clostridium sp.]
MGYKIIIILVLLAVFFTWQNNHILINKIDYKNKRIPKAFNGFKILQISDLHNKDFKGRLSKKIKSVNPDIIVITGDIIDRQRTDLDKAIKLIKEIKDMCPVYYISGNHENSSPRFNELKDKLKSNKVKVLDNSLEIIKRNNECICLFGVADVTISSWNKEYRKYKRDDYYRVIIDELKKNSQEGFSILLSHRPELIKIYAEKNIDLAFSGHAHGGQVRLPLIGGLYAPGQGILPKYTSGIHKIKNTSLVVNRGLGNSGFPFRIFNRPEIVLVNLVTEYK